MYHRDCSAFPFYVVRHRFAGKYSEPAETDSRTSCFNQWNTTPQCSYSCSVTTHGPGWQWLGNSPDTKQTDAEGFFLKDLREDDEPHIYILGVEYHGYIAKTDPFIIDEEKPQVPFLLTLNGDPTQEARQTSDQAYAALERFLHPPAVWVVNPANGHAYKRICCQDIIDASAQAAVENAYVVALNDRAEEVWIKNAFRHEIFWIGLSDAAEEGKWAWHSGEPVEYTNWEEKYHAAEGDYGDERLRHRL